MYCGLTTLYQFYTGTVLPSIINSFVSICQEGTLKIMNNIIKVINNYLCQSFKPTKIWR